MVSEIKMNPTEKYVDEICQFLSLDKEAFNAKLKDLREKGWQRWGGGTVEVTVAELLYVLVRMLNPNHAFEGGTSWGYSTAHIAQGLKDNGKVPDESFSSVDIDPEAHRMANTFLWEKDLELSLNLVPSVKWMEDRLAAQQPPLDFVFIDTSHTYEYTKEEWKALLPLLHDKSVITFHDAFTETYGVKKFLQELPSTYKVLILDTQPNTGFGIVIKDV